MSDAAYALTRRRGQQVTVVRAIETEANPETGEREISTEVHNVRLAVKTETSYSRVIKAKTAQVDIGQTMFIFWVRDISFTQLNAEDYVICGGDKFQVVTAQIEETSFVVTTKQVIGTVGKQVIELSTETSMGLESDAAEV